MLENTPEEWENENEAGFTETSQLKWLSLTASEAQRENLFSQLCGKMMEIKGKYFIKRGKPKKNKQH